MRGLTYALGLALLLSVAAPVRAGGCGYAASYAIYSNPYYGFTWYPTGVYPTPYGDRFFTSGYYNGYYQYGVGMTYGIPVIQLAAVPLVAPAVAAYPTASMPQQAMPAQAAAPAGGLTAQETDEIRQFIRYLKEQQKTTPPPASGGGQ